MVFVVAIWACWKESRNDLVFKGEVREVDEINVVLSGNLKLGSNKRKEKKFM